MDVRLELRHHVAKRPREGPHTSVCRAFQGVILRRRKPPLHLLGHSRRRLAACRSQTRSAQRTVVRFSNHSQRKSLATCAMGPKPTDRQRPRQRTADSPRLGRIDRQHLGAEGIREGVEIVLVLLRIERARRINEQSARTKRRPNVMHNATLPSGAEPHRLQTPLRPRRRRLTKHPLARARHIGHNEVETVRQPTEIFRVSLGHDHARGTPLGHVFGQNATAAADRFVTYQQAPLGQRADQVRRLTTGRSAEVERHDRLRHVTADGPLEEHRGRLLDVIGARMEQRIESESGPLREITPCLTPRHTVPHRNLSPVRRLPRVHTQTDRRRTL